MIAPPAALPHCPCCGRGVMPNSECANCGYFVHATDPAIASPLAEDAPLIPHAHDGVVLVP